MRLSFSTNAFKRNTLEEAVDSIAGCGYGGVELMADLHHALPERMTPALRRDLKKRLADRGVLVSNVNAFTLFACSGGGDTYHPTWIEESAELRQRRIEHTVRSVELAAEMGCATVSLQPGGPLLGTDLTDDEAGKRFAQGLEACIPTARACGVTLAIEPEPGLFIQTSEEYFNFKRRFFPSERAIRMNCDLGHLFCVGEDPAEVIRIHAGEIAHVHLEDIGANRVHQHLTPGRGVIDFASIFTALADTRYAGHVTVELYPYETSAAGVARVAMEHLKPLLSS